MLQTDFLAMVTSFICNLQKLASYLKMKSTSSSSSYLCTATSAEAEELETVGTIVPHVLSNIFKSLRL